ncbi:MAG: hypothetical protein ACK5VX_11800, partial [Akkermansiaceae bacterium]
VEIYAGETPALPCLQICFCSKILNPKNFKAPTSSGRKGNKGNEGCSNFTFTNLSTVKGN